MSSVGVSRDGQHWSVTSGRVAVLGVLVVLALITVAVLIGRWSASASVTPADSSGGSRPAAATAPAAPVPGPIGSITGEELPGGGVLNGGGAVCLMARPC
jgi:hypothetical protein